MSRIKYLASGIHLRARGGRELAKHRPASQAAFGFSLMNVLCHGLRFRRCFVCAPAPTMRGFGFDRFGKLRMVRGKGAV